jgi:hypothetical protein
MPPLISPIPVMALISAEEVDSVVVVIPLCLGSRMRETKNEVTSPKTKMVVVRSNMIIGTR